MYRHEFNCPTRAACAIIPISLLRLPSDSKIRTCKLKFKSMNYCTLNFRKLWHPVLTLKNIIKLSYDYYDKIMSAFSLSWIDFIKQKKELI